MERIYIVKIGNEVAAAFSSKMYADHYVHTYLYALKNVTVVSMPIDDKDMIGDTPPHVEAMDEDMDDHEQEMSATYAPADEAEEDADADGEDIGPAERAFLTFMRMLSELGDEE